jgi:uncharacterized SAM-binding protein YcdF (DUF218 family)
MYFILSKVLLFLILPIYWVVILLVVAAVSKERKRKRRFLIAAIIVLYVFSNSFLLDLFARKWDVQFQPLNNTQHYSCAIVLGGFSSSDGRGGGYFSFSADRFIQAIKLIETKKIAHLLITGGNGNLFPGGFREAGWAKTQLSQFNIPDSAVLIENNSKNTFENARFSKALLQKTHLPPPYLLVTSAFHMRRSLMLFKHAGITVIPYPCNYLVGNDRIKITDFLPTSDALFIWEIYIKEVVGYAVNYFK